MPTKGEMAGAAASTGVKVGAQAVGTYFGGPAGGEVAKQAAAPVADEVGDTVSKKVDGEEKDGDKKKGEKEGDKKGEDKEESDSWAMDLLNSIYKTGEDIRTSLMSLMSPGPDTPSVSGGAEKSIGESDLGNKGPEGGVEAPAPDLDNAASSGMSMGM